MTTATTPAVHPHRAATLDRAIEKNIYVTNDMVEASATLRGVAADFVSTYRGFNAFVQDLAVKLADRGVLSTGQLRGALNVMIAEEKTRRAELAAVRSDAAPYIDLRSKKDLEVDAAGDAPAAEDSQLTTGAPNGIYTIVLNATTDEYRTLRLIDAPEHFSAKPGTQIAQYLGGADNEASYTGFAFVTGGTFKVWRKFSGDSKIVAALKILLDGDPIQHMLAYGMRFDHCGVCGRRLTTPESKRAGIGPICAGKLEAAGYSVDIPAETRQAARQRAIADMDELFND